jgi:hypothetical protein
MTPLNLRDAEGTVRMSTSRDEHVRTRARVRRRRFANCMPVRYFAPSRPTAGMLSRGLHTILSTTRRNERDRASISAARQPARTDEAGAEGIRGVPTRFPRWLYAQTGFRMQATTPIDRRPAGRSRSIAARPKQSSLPVELSSLGVRRRESNRGFNLSGVTSQLLPNGWAAVAALECVGPRGAAARALDASPSDKVAPAEDPTA